MQTVVLLVDAEEVWFDEDTDADAAASLASVYCFFCVLFGFIAHAVWQARRRPTRRGRSRRKQGHSWAPFRASASAAAAAAVAVAESLRLRFRHRWRRASKTSCSTLNSPQSSADSSLSNTGMLSPWSRPGTASLNRSNSLSPLTQLAAHSTPRSFRSTRSDEEETNARLDEEVNSTLSSPHARSDLSESAKELQAAQEASTPQTEQRSVRQKRRRNAALQPRPKAAARKRCTVNLRPGGVVQRPESSPAATGPSLKKLQQRNPAAKRKPNVDDEGCISASASTASLSSVPSLPSSAPVPLQQLQRASPKAACANTSERLGELLVNLTVCTARVKPPTVTPPQPQCTVNAVSHSPPPPPPPPPPGLRCVGRRACAPLDRRRQRPLEYSSERAAAVLRPRVRSTLSADAPEYVPRSAWCDDDAWAGASDFSILPGPARHEVGHSSNVLEMAAIRPQLNAFAKEFVPQRQTEPQHSSSSVDTADDHTSDRPKRECCKAPAEPTFKLLPNVHWGAKGPPVRV
eukprot:TRINITY_DN16446_c0_g1_i1.p1 TRINITY_DN16446_c0_g1~~TRINITY_DN16446_c0_g1_i1.p1  ORF type:complete len:546 (+),score=35.59 TRINITY_DN16446_c0_g1_i1:84-1640(+)